jgi:hypothetical protein
MKKVVKKITLDKNKHVSNNYIQHVVNGKPAPDTAVLQIEAITNISQNEESIYLVHYDSEMKEITDTFHENIIDAMEQAKLEFKINENDWE